MDNPRQILEYLTVSDPESPNHKVLRKFCFGAYKDPGPETYAQAIAAYDQVLERMESTSDEYQKLEYCYQILLGEVTRSKFRSEVQELIENARISVAEYYEQLLVKPAPEPVASGNQVHSERFDLALATAFGAPELADVRQIHDGETIE